MTVEFSAGRVSPGELFSCTAHICNPSAEMTATPFVAMLDIGISEYWFYPSWAHWPPGFDYTALDLPTGITDEAVVPEFLWPDTGTDTLGGITIWGTLLNNEMTELRGSLGSDTFGYGP